MKLKRVRVKAKSAQSGTPSKRRKPSRSDRPAEDKKKEDQLAVKEYNSVDCGDSDEGVAADDAHKKLLSAISTIGKKSRTAVEHRDEVDVRSSSCGHVGHVGHGSGGSVSAGLGRRVEGPAVSEFHLVNDSASGKMEGEEEPLEVMDLLEGLGSSGGFAELKRRLARAEVKNAPEEPPLSRPQAERIQRAVAYKETSTQISKWQPVVKSNREADHLSFPLQEEHPSAITSISSRVQGFQPMNELEKKVSDVLVASECVEREGEELTPAEKKALLRMRLEEARERRRELQRLRALSLFHEQKCKRISRIKSKRYHRMLRKKREAEEVSQVPSGGSELERAERIRAKERMTLKHTSKSKWAKEQLTRKHRDPAVQLALSEHHQRRRKLKQHNSVEDTDSNDSESLYSEGENDEKEHSELKSSQQRNPWLQHASKGSSVKCDGVLLLDKEVQHDESSKMVQGVSGDERSEEEEEEEEEETNDEEDVEQRNDLELVRENAVDSQRLQGKPIGDKAHIDPTAFLKGSSVGGSGPGGGKRVQQFADISSAFAGEDVVGEFEEEKEQVVEKSKPKDVDLTLPGWGTWAGDGVKEPRVRVRVVKRAKPVRPRKDQSLHLVIIDECKSKAMMKHQVSSLPRGYTSKQQFENHHSQPVGRQWNSEKTFHRLIRPKVSCSIGEVIQPLKFTEDVQEFIKRTEKNRPRAQRKGQTFTSH